MRTLRKSMVGMFAALAVAGSIGGSTTPRDSIGFATDPCPSPDLVLRAPLAWPRAFRFAQRWREAAAPG